LFYICEKEEIRYKATKNHNILMTTVPPGGLLEYTRWQIFVSASVHSFIQYYGAIPLICWEDPDVFIKFQIFYSSVFLPCYVDVNGFNFCSIDPIFQLNSMPSTGWSLVFTDSTVQAMSRLDCDHHQKHLEMNGITLVYTYLFYKPFTANLSHQGEEDYGFQPDRKGRLSKTKQVLQQGYTAVVPLL
jgi:hypothetical protein